MIMIMIPQYEICRLFLNEVSQLVAIVKVGLTSFTREINYLADVSFTRFFVLASKLSSQMGRVVPGWSELLMSAPGRFFGCEQEAARA